MRNPMVYLASKSPRRAHLLQQLGISYKLLDAAVDEQLLEGESAESYVCRLALEKATTAWKACALPMIPVIGADTCIVLDGKVIGKPTGRERGIEILKSLSDRWHTVLTAVAVVSSANEEFQLPDARVQLNWRVTGQRMELVALNESQVQFGPMSDGEIEAYWDSGEPWDKAGAYAIQGKAALFIRSVQGSYSGIMGLPLYETGELLRLSGVDLGSVKHEGAQ